MTFIDLVLGSFVRLLGVAGIFVIMFYAGRFIKNRLESSTDIKSSRFFNPKEYLPEEELTTLKQVFYLVMIMFFVFGILYSVFIWEHDLHTFFILDIIVSIYLALQIKGKSRKNMLILFALIPFGSLYQLIFGTYFYMGLFDIFHVIIFAYMIKVYYNKFSEYTQTNSLGITIMLLFLIVFISFLFTIVVEDVNPLDSIAMVSNAFTSNGYAVLGSSGIGKVNALVLVWSGFLLSGVGTATLTVAIVMKHVNEKFDRLERLAKKNKEN